MLLFFRLGISKVGIENWGQILNITLSENNMCYYGEAWFFDQKNEYYGTDLQKCSLELYHFPTKHKKVLYKSVQPKVCTNNW